MLKSTPTTHEPSTRQEDLDAHELKSDENDFNDHDADDAETFDVKMAKRWLDARD